MFEYNIILNSNCKFTNYILFGQEVLYWLGNKWDTCACIFMKQPCRWQQVDRNLKLAQHGHGGQQPIMMHFILPPLSHSSPLSIFFSPHYRTWGDNKKLEGNRVRSGSTWYLRQAWCLPWALPHPGPSYHQPIRYQCCDQLANERTSWAHVSVVWRCLTRDVSMCKTRTQRGDPEIHITLPWAGSAARHL